MGLYIPDHRVLEDAAGKPQDVIRYDLPYKADLMPKFMGVHPTLDEEATGGRPVSPKDYRSNIQTGETLPVGVTEPGDEIYSNEGRLHSDILGHNTPVGLIINRLEDRVIDKSGGGPTYFSDLPEVKHIQYGLSSMHMINHILSKGLSPKESDDMFRRWKHSIGEDPAYPDFAIPLHDESDRKTGRLYDGFPYFPKESFMIKRLAPQGPDEDWQQYHERSKNPEVIDFFHGPHTNISQMYASRKNEGIQEHLSNLMSNYNGLWDKLESGMYVRHPNFWLPHAFSSANDRNSCWKQIQEQAPEIKVMS